MIIHFELKLDGAPIGRYETREKAEKGKRIETQFGIEAFRLTIEGVEIGDAEHNSKAVD